MGKGSRSCLAVAYNALAIIMILLAYAVVKSGLSGHLRREGVKSGAIKENKMHSFSIL